MQPEQEASPWPKRLMISGLVLGLIGAGLFSYLLDDFNDYYDPRETSDHTALYGQQNKFEIEPGCWVVNLEGSDDDYTVKFLYADGEDQEDRVPEGCSTDFQAMAADTEFTEITKLDIEKKTNITIIIECEQGEQCNNVLYLTNGDAVILDMVTDQGLITTLGACCLGAFIFPLGWILMTINKNKSSNVTLMQDQVTDIMSQEDSFIKGTQKDILTTDQVYKLVRGETPNIEQNKPNVPSPFSDTDTRPTAVSKAKSTGSIYSASAHTPEKPPEDESWKNWDES